MLKHRWHGPTSSFLLHRSGVGLRTRLSDLFPAAAGPGTTRGEGKLKAPPAKGRLILSSLLGICSVSGHHPYRALPQAHLSHAHSSSPGLRQWFLNFLSPLSSHYLFAFMPLSNCPLPNCIYNVIMKSTAPLFWKLIRDKPELCQQLTITSVTTMRCQNSSLKQRNQTF